MGKIIFNYLKVNNTYSNYRSEAEEIYSIKNEMAKIYERLCNEWKDSANVGFRNEAANISYTDVYDFSSVKQSLKKFEIELGIFHQEWAHKWN